MADEATKRSNEPQLDYYCRWFQGPAFLKLQPEDWPIKEKPECETNEEELNVVLHHSEKETVVDVTRFSNWKRLHRTMAYVIRFKNSFRKFRKSRDLEQLYGTNISSSELEEAECLLFKIAQTEAFATEIELLNRGDVIPHQSSLFKLSPYLGEDGMIRMDSRIGNAPVSYDTRRPIILPPSHAITALLIGEYHRKYLHQHHEVVVNELRRRFCIPRLRVVVKKISNDCNHCKIRKATPQIPRMAQLPKARVTPFTPPFAFTGLDYFGPISVTHRRCQEKRYGVLFTCLVTRAVHIEIAYSLDVSSCIMAIRNFMQRHGEPAEIYSDNGTNFVAAERVLRELVDKLDVVEISKHFTSSTLKWKFNPPAAPNMGGAWERLVRSMKNALYASLPTRNPTDEVLRSALMEAEGILNARPLTYLPLDSPESDALTPNHFLRGGSIDVKAFKCDDSPEALINNYRAAQAMSNRYWHRWIREYLPELTRRQKWFNEGRKLEVGDVVLIVDPNSPRNTYPKGVIVEVITAKDDKVRQVIVKTATGQLKRPASKIAALDIRKSVDGGGECNAPIPFVGRP